MSRIAVVGRPGNEATAAPPIELLPVASALIIAAHLGLRAWSLLPSWFYTDDYRLINEALGGGFGRNLLMPFDSQLMPWGRLLAEGVAATGPLNWTLAAALTLTMQLIADVALLWMLTTIAGRRWAILAPLCLYATSAATLPATMWWAASLNQVPAQAAFFAAVGCWIRYLRNTSERRWLILSMLAVIFGLTAYVKAILILPVLAWLLLALTAGPGARLNLGNLVRRWWAALLTATLVGLVYVTYYLAAVPRIFTGTSTGDLGDLVYAMVGKSFVTGAVGGPWRWDDFNPPTAYANPPEFMVPLACCVVLGTVALSVLRRERTARFWTLLVFYVALDVVLVATSRAPVAGVIVGSEYRYLTDATPVLVLVLCLATMSSADLPGSSRTRMTPMILPLPSKVVVTATMVVSVSGVTSSISYASIWHTNNPGEAYINNAIDGLSSRGQVAMASQVVPASVVPPFSSPANTTERLLPLALTNVTFPTSTSRLVVLDSDGSPREAAIDAGATSKTGPSLDCGWLVRDRPQIIPMTSDLFDFTWWMRIGYLSSSDDSLEVTVLDRSGEIASSSVVNVERGVHSTFVEVTAQVSAVSLTSADPRTTVCVDTVEVGNPVPGGPL